MAFLGNATTRLEEEAHQEPESVATPHEGRTAEALLVRVAARQGGDDAITAAGVPADAPGDA